jgi:hypothetical protein
MACSKMWIKIGNIAKRMSKKRNDIAIVILWTALVSFIVIKSYWITYITSQRLSYFQIPFTLYEGPAAGALDIVVIVIASIVVGLFLSDAVEMLLGFTVAIFLTFVISVIYVTLYIWYVLGWGVLFGAVAYDWEYAVFFAVLTVFRIMFPWIVGICLIGLVIGAFLRTWVV